jgi:hypothetical protein
LLAGGEAAWMGPGRHPRAGGNGAHAEIAHGTAYEPSCRVGPKIKKPRPRTLGLASSLVSMSASAAS